MVAEREIEREKERDRARESEGEKRHRRWYRRRNINHRTCREKYFIAPLEGTAIKAQTRQVTGLIQGKQEITAKLSDNIGFGHPEETTVAP